MNGLGFMQGETGGMPDWLLRQRGWSIPGFGGMQQIPGMGGGGFGGMPGMGMGGAMPQQQPQAPQTLGDAVNAQVGRPPTMKQKFMDGLGRLRDGLTPIDPRVAAQMDPNYVKQLRSQAIMNMGLGMMSAAGRGGGFGESLAQGIGGGQQGLSRNIEDAYRVGVQDRQERRQIDRDAIGDARYEDQTKYGRGRDATMDARHDRERGQDLAYREQQAGMESRRVAAYEDRVAQMEKNQVKLSDIDKMRREYHGIIQKVQDSDNSAQNLLMLTGRPDAATDPQSQIAMVFSFQRMMEPDSVTREQEYQIIQNARGLQEELQNILPRLQTGARLTPQQIARMGNIASMMAGKANERISAKTGYYTELAEKRGIDPFEVTGSHNYGRKDPNAIDVGAGLGGGPASTVPPAGGLGTPPLPQKRSFGYGAGRVEEVDY